MAGVYVHIPFCNSFCIYCGFYSVINKQIRDSYIPALKREISERRNFFDAGTEQNANSNFSAAGTKINTLYFGGGTPSVLQISQLEEIVRCVKENFQFVADGEGKFVAGGEGKFEFTVEVNPDDITPEYAAGLKSMGANRISMGVQSFDDEQLKWMHRRHSAAEAVAAFGILHDAGFCNISIDLIFGFAGMNRDIWKQNIEKAIVLGPE